MQTLFVAAIEYLILDVIRSFSMRNSEDKCLEEQWKLMDPQNTNKLSLEMLQGLLQKLKFGMYKPIFEYLMETYDVDKDKMIDFTEFKEFQIQLSKMSELKKLYEIVIEKDHTVVMEGFWKYLAYEEKRPKLTYDQVWRIIINYSDYTFSHLTDVFHDYEEMSFAQMEKYYSENSASQIKSTLSFEKSHIINYKGFFKYINSLEGNANEIKPSTFGLNTPITSLIYYSVADACYDPVSKTMSMEYLADCLQKGVRVFRFKIDEKMNVKSHKNVIPLDKVCETLKKNATAKPNFPIFIYLDPLKGSGGIFEQSVKLCESIIGPQSTLKINPNEPNEIKLSECMDKFVIFEMEIEQPNDLGDEPEKLNGVKDSASNKKMQELFGLDSGKVVEDKYSPEKMKSFTDLHKSAVKESIDKKEPVQQQITIVESVFKSEENKELKICMEEIIIDDKIKQSPIKELHDKYKNSFGLVKRKEAEVNPLYYWFRGLQVVTTKPGTISSLVQYIYFSFLGNSGLSLHPAYNEELSLQLTIYGITQMRDIGEFESLFKLEFKWALINEQTTTIEWVTKELECVNEVNIELNLEPMKIKCVPRSCIVYSVSYKNKEQYRGVLLLHNFKYGAHSVPLFDSTNRRHAYSNMILKIESY